MATQLIAFNQSTAGTTKGMCEQNVRLGFGLAAKYATAWQAWVNTDQHTEPMPDGLDIPLFYSYTDANGNEGHINVRLANGQVWSDGNLYPSLAAYEAAHLPKYVGWSTKVEGVAVIKLTEGDTMYPNQGDIINIWRKFLKREPNANDIAYWTTGTGNPAWAKGASEVWKALFYALDPPASTVSKQAVIDYVNNHLS